MLTRPEISSKQLLTIAVSPGKHSHLRLKNKNIVYEKDGEIVNQCSLSRILHLVVIGDVSLTTNLIREINDNGISVCLLKHNLAPFAYFGFQTDANFVLRARQYQMTDEENLQIARSIIAGKMHNQKILLSRLNMEDDEIAPYIKKSASAPDRNTLLGLEGSASKAFFGQYYEEFGWIRRAPRTKEDEVNFMLDIGYTVLFNFIDAVCRHFGLDTYKGVYHQQFFARRSLVCDLMEPFRCLIDNRTRTALTLKIVTPDIFRRGKYGVYTEWRDSSKITTMYAEEIMKHRVHIFTYVQDFYKHIMDQHDKLPSYKLKR
jgi:CRISPR-associated protein Cas1